jgi:hypothetical protein
MGCIFGAIDNAIVRLVWNCYMSSGEQVLQKIIYLLQNRCCSMLCRPLQAVRVHGDLSARQRLPIFQMSNFAGRVPGLATGLMCCRRGDKLFSFFFGPGHCWPQLLQGSLFRGKLRQAPQPTAIASHSRAPTSLRPSLSVRAARAWDAHQIRPRSASFPGGDTCFVPRNSAVACVCLALVRSAPGASRP